MAGKTHEPKSERRDYHARQVRRNQVIFISVAVILILSMALSRPSRWR